ncbi:MAG: energy-coupling factor transporter transmembrane protein EcfT [Bacilli bacterium]|nr:energy-coupling factor transporter transmembrane protein EcfT [Bacilli bacterium]MDD4809042.1 energy-coupling factor transporter transmembrane protein EcfT [Bacilli bacterium]
MLNNIMIGRYYPVNSKIHGMHPLSKIICTLLFITMTFMTESIELNFFLAGITFLMMIMSHVPLTIYFKAINSLKVLIIFIVIINLIFMSTLDIVVIMILRLILIVIYTSILTLSTPPNEITYGLELLLSPLKLIGVPVNKTALSISLALKFIPTIIDQGNKILKSQSSRGIDYNNSKFKGKFMAVKAMLFPMFVLTLKRADQLADIMEVRLYNINDKRTNFRINKWHFFDTYLVMIHLTLLIFIVVSEVVI